MTQKSPKSSNHVEIVEIFKKSFELTKKSEINFKNCANVVKIAKLVLKIALKNLLK